MFPGVGTGLPTGLRELDQQLLPHGGLSRATVTELVGPAGVGKSQCAFQLCLHVAAQRRGETAIYIDTEGKAMARHRLREMAAATATATRLEPHDEYEYQDHTGSLVRPEGHVSSSSRGLPYEDSSYPIEYWSFPESSLEDLVQTILVQVQEFVYLNKEEHEEEEEQESTVNMTGDRTTMALDAPYSQNGWLEPSHSHAASEDGWYTSLRAPKQQQQHSILDDSYPQQQQQQRRRRRRPVSLIVVDSIAAPFRRHSHSSSSSQQLLQVAQTLKRMAHEFQVCVVVVNQVASSNTDGSTLERRESRQADTQAAWWEENADEHNENATTTNQESLDSHDYNNYHYFYDTTTFLRIHNDGQDHTSNHGSSFRAALGTSWHHCVSTRILFTPAMDTPYPSDHPPEQRTKGYASIVKSNLIATPTVPVPYTITLQGLEAL